MESTVVQSILQRANNILEDISAESQLELHPLREVYQYLANHLSADYIPQKIGS